MVAKKYSIDPTTKNKGGVLTNVTKGQQDAALSKAAFAATTNKLIGPVKGQFGYYVVEVTKITPATQKSLAAVECPDQADAHQPGSDDCGQRGRQPGQEGLAEQDQVPHDLRDGGLHRLQGAEDQHDQRRRDGTLAAAPAGTALAPLLATWPTARRTPPTR